MILTNFHFVQVLGHLIINSCTLSNAIRSEDHGGFVLVFEEFRADVATYGERIPVALG